MEHRASNGLLRGGDAIGRELEKTKDGETNVGVEIWTREVNDGSSYWQDKEQLHDKKVAGIVFYGNALDPFNANRQRAHRSVVQMDCCQRSHWTLATIKTD